MKKLIEIKKPNIFLKYSKSIHTYSSICSENKVQEKVIPKTSIPPTFDWNNSKETFKHDLFVSSNTENNKPIKTIEQPRNDAPPRYNVFGVQMLSEKLFVQLFKSQSKMADENKIRSCLADLKKYSLNNVQETIPSVEFDLPPLQGKNLEEHFYNISFQQSEVYKSLLYVLLDKIPPLPQSWVFQDGWTRYFEDKIEKVDYPLEDAFVFDVEVCRSEGELPTIATAVSHKAWYSWVSSHLVCGTSKLKSQNFTVDQFIPLESSPKDKGCNIPSSLRKKRIAVGHNVSFDRARVKEQYWLERTGMRFIDTLSLHICVSGITSYQKALLKAGVAEDEWSQLSSLNSLSKVHELYCGSEISKEHKTMFITGSLSNIQENFQTAMEYCGKDVLATHSVLKELLPMFFQRFPHPATFAGMLELQTAYLPVNSNWNKYLSESQQAYEDLELESKSLLIQSADEGCKLMHSGGYEKDIWLWDQDWSVKSLNLRKSNPKKGYNNKNIIVEGNCSEEVNHLTDELYEKYHDKFFQLLETKEKLPAKVVHLPGYPIWYRKLCSKPVSDDWVPGPDLIGTGMQIAPKLLQMTWKGMPLHYVRGSGWGFIVPYLTDIPIELEGGIPFQELVQYCIDNGKLCNCHQISHMNNYKKRVGHSSLTCKKHKNKSTSVNDKICKLEINGMCGLIKLPHKDGAHMNVGNPLARDFINKFSNIELSGSQLFAQKIIEISRMLSYWRNSRERIENQLVCWLDKADIPKKYRSKLSLGAILPQVIVSGTLTRRAVEPTWMTASNAIVERVGSELRGMVQAPSGFSFVGADVDSQELWIAALLGDSYLAGMHGASPFGWMTINGQKSGGTDMHSVTAKAVGISRSQAKVINYARIYGAGQNFSERLLKQFNPGISTQEAKNKASAMFLMTKGKKSFILRDGVLPDIKERAFSKDGAKEICNLHKKTIEDLFESPKWYGGTESSMFNCLEEIASKTYPETPFLRSRLSRALEPKIDHSDKYTPTRINWVVQSGAVDFLHLMLVSMRWLLGPKARFSLSFHDEVRYLVPTEYKYEAALALHVTNLLTRAFCVERLGMIDLPQSVAFFSSVEIDQVLRKEAKDENKTPSNPYGLKKGYGISLGESVTIYEAIEKSKGIIGIQKVKTKENKEKCQVLDF